MDIAPSERIRYEDLEPRLRTGDILLFHGASSLSRVIEKATRSEFSHIGMVVVIDPGTSPLLWHTHPRSVAEDIEDRRKHDGAQLNDLRSAISVMTNPNYGDTPYVRQLTVSRAPGFNAEALKAITAMDETSFPSPFGVVKEWILGHLHVATSGKTMYCADVLARTYRRMGLLPSDPPSNSYSPRDFSAEHEKLRLLRGARLGPELEIQWTGPASSEP